MITVGEILSSYFSYPITELIDSDTRGLLAELRGFGDVGDRLANKVEERLYGISESFCRYLVDCLDDGFFQRTEAKNSYDRLVSGDIKQRLKAAYNVRSQFIHSGKFQAGWMSVNYLHNNEEVIHGDPVIPDKEVRKAIKRSPTFIGMERIARYALIKFLIKTGLVSDFSSEVGGLGSVDDGASENSAK